MKIDHESLIGTFEQKREQVRKFNLMDDDFFAVVMQDKEAFQVMLRILIGRDDLHVKEVRTQYALRNLVGHSVVLDGYAVDDNNKAYNVEIQVKNNDYHEKRARYYQSNLDITLLEKGTKYKDLPDLYIIFITSFDIFKKGRNHYKLKTVLDEFGDEIDEGVHKLYFNTAVKDDTRISDLMQYFKNSTSDNQDFGPLSDRVKYYKETQEGVGNMCDAVKEYGNEREAFGKEIGKEIGRAEERANNIIQVVKALMKNANCSLEDALKMADYTLEDYNKSLLILATDNK